MEGPGNEYADEHPDADPHQHARSQRRLLLHGQSVRKRLLRRRRCLRARARMPALNSRGLFAELLTLIGVGAFTLRRLMRADTSQIEYRASDGDHAIDRPRPDEDDR